MYKKPNGKSPAKKTMRGKTPVPSRAVRPYAKSYTKSSYRGKTSGRSYRRVPRKSTYSKLSFNRGLGTGIVFPDIYKCKLSYSHDASFLTSAISNFLYRGNGPYDPEYTATGSQPAYYDQLAAIYSMYRCMGCKITIKILNGGTNLDYLALYPSTSTTLVTNLVDARSLPYCASTILTGKDGKGYTKLKMYMSTKKIFGVDSIMAEDNFASAVSTVPADQWYWVFLAQDVSNSTKTIYYTTKLTYYMQFERRIQLNQS